MRLRIDEESPTEIGRSIGAPALSMKCLGRHGQWGNAVMQYAFLRVLGEQFGRRVETSKWLGQTLFEIDDPPITALYPDIVLDFASQMQNPKNRFWRASDHRLERARRLQEIGRTTWGLHTSDDALVELPFDDAELEGHFMVHTRYLAPFRDRIRAICRPRPEILASVTPVVQRLRESGRPVVGVHVRRGDFLDPFGIHGFEHVVSMAAYRGWLEHIRESHGDPIVYVASQDASAVIPQLDGFDAVSEETLGARLPELAVDLPEHAILRDPSLFVDWYVLTQCDHVAISNSSFSFTASMCNDRGGEFVRPSYATGALVAFDPWNSEPVAFHPHRRFIGSEFLARYRYQSAPLGRRQRARAIAVIPRIYGRFLGERMAVCRSYRGYRGLVRAMLDPRFYLVTRRFYEA